MNPVHVILNNHPELREPLAVLGMFQELADVKLLAEFCARPSMPDAVSTLHEPQWQEAIGLLQDEGLLTRPGPATAGIPPATHTTLAALLRERSAGHLVLFEGAFIDVHHRFASEVNREYGASPERAEPMLRPHEQNLMQALHLAARHARWAQAGELLRVIEKLFAPAGHWKEWQWVLRGFEREMINAPEQPTPHSLWEHLAERRMSVPDHARDLEGEETHLRAMREHFERAADQASLVRTLRQLAHLATLREQHPSGEGYYRECLPHAAQLRNPPLHCAILNDLARSLLHQKQIAGAEKVLQESLAMARELPDRGPELRTLILLDEAARSEGEWQKAEGRCRELLLSAEKSQDRPAEADALERLGDLALKQHLPDAAEHYFHRSREIWRAGGNEVREAEILASLGDVSRLRRNPDRARELFEESLKIHARLGHRAGQAAALARLGAMDLETHDVERAGTRFFQCQQFLGSLHNPGLEATILSGLARVAYCREAFASAQNFYQQTLAIHETRGLIAEIANDLYNLGLVAERLNDLPRARKRHQRSLEFAARAGDEPKQIRALLQLASIALQQGQFQEAEQRCLEGLPMAERQNTPNDIAEFHYRLGRVAVQLCRPEEAETHFEKALRTHQSTAAEGLEWHLKVLSHLSALPGLSKAELTSHYRNTLVHAETGGDRASQLKLLYKLAELSEAQRQWLDTEHWLRRCLGLEQESTSTGPQAQLLQRIGLLLDAQGRPHEATSLFRRSIALNGFPSGEHAYHPAVMLRLAQSALEQNQLEDALIDYQHCLRISKDLGDLGGLVEATLGLGRIALRTGDLENTRRWLEQSIAASANSAPSRNHAEVLVELGDLERRCGQFKAAERHYRSALALYEDLLIETAQAGTWVRLADLAEEQEKHPEALTCFERARALFQVLRDAPNLYRVRTAIQRLQKTLA